MGINMKHEIMKQMSGILLILSVFWISGCEFYQSPNPEDYKQEATDNKALFIEQYDQTSDNGQYWLPKQKQGTNYWVVINGTSNENSFEDNSLRNHLLAESIIGLCALAVNEGTSTTMVWSDSPNSNYAEVKDRIDMVENGTQTTWELLKHHDNVKSNIDGYVLCKLRKEESVVVATIASHVHRAVIVDEYYEDSIIALGYEMKYDARNKTLSDAWSEFKDNCENDALILMPTHTGQLKSFAIAHRLMMVNYNKEMGDPSEGTNESIFREALAWLEPLSPVLGWEQGLGEDAFVQPISESGNMMVPADWLVNSTMMSAEYENNQSGIANVTNPQFIDYSDSLHYASFFLTDGDNVQWMMNNFRSGDYYLNELNSEVKMSFGLPVANLAMLSPYQLERLFSEQVTDNSLIEFGGGGYYYPDNFGRNKNRTELLQGIAQKVGDHMRQKRVKVLGLICKDVTSIEAQEAYQAYISNNDQLTGIIAIQYHPYAGGDGEIMWFENADGIDIPVITARYAIWNHGNMNWPSQGTPNYIASKINEQASSGQSAASLVAVHAWSKFKDIGESDDPIEQNIGGNTAGVYPVAWCKDKLNENVKVVNVEELIWQFRMQERPEQTIKYLENYY